jgi:hypothetical protein
MMDPWLVSDTIAEGQVDLRNRTVFDGCQIAKQNAEFFESQRGIEAYGPVEAARHRQAWDMVFSAMYTHIQLGHGAEVW